MPLFRLLSNLLYELDEGSVLFVGLSLPPAKGLVSPGGRQRSVGWPSVLCEH